MTPSPNIAAHLEISVGYGLAAAAVALAPGSDDKLLLAFLALVCIVNSKLKELAMLEKDKP